MKSFFFIYGQINQNQPSDVPRTIYHSRSPLTKPINRNNPSACPLLACLSRASATGSPASLRPHAPCRPGGEETMIHLAAAAAKISHLRDIFGDMSQPPSEHQSEIFSFLSTSTLFVPFPPPLLPTQSSPHVQIDCELDCSIDSKGFNSGTRNAMDRPGRSDRRASKPTPNLQRIIHEYFRGTLGPFAAAFPFSLYPFSLSLFLFLPSLHRQKRHHHPNLTAHSRMPLPLLGSKAARIENKRSKKRRRKVHVPFGRYFRAF